MDLRKTLSNDQKILMIFHAFINDVFIFVLIRQTHEMCENQTLLKENGFTVISKVLSLNQNYLLENILMTVFIYQGFFPLALYKKNCDTGS